MEECFFPFYLFLLFMRRIVGEVEVVIVIARIELLGLLLFSPLFLVLQEFGEGKRGVGRRSFFSPCGGYRSRRRVFLLVAAVDVG